MNIGLILKKARYNKDLTQEFIAQGICVSQKTYSNFENNKSTPNLVQIAKISKLLSIDMQQFMDVEAKNTESTTENNSQELNPIAYERLISQYQEKIESQNQEIEFLKQTINKLIK